MADVKVVDSGRCPKCDGTTEIKSVNSWPFQEDERHKMVETCKTCNFEIETGFSSTDATTSIDHNERESSQKARVARVMPLVTALHLSGDAGADLAEMRSILAAIENWDFPLLYVELAKTASSTEVRGLVKAVEAVRRKKT